MAQTIGQEVSRCCPFLASKYGFSKVSLPRSCVSLYRTEYITFAQNCRVVFLFLADHNSKTSHYSSKHEHFLCVIVKMYALWECAQAISVDCVIHKNSGIMKFSSFEIITPLLWFIALLSNSYVLYFGL